MSVDKRMSLVSFHYIDTLATSITYEGWKNYGTFNQTFEERAITGYKFEKFGKTN